MNFIGNDELHGASRKLQEEKDGASQVVGWFFRQPSHDRWNTSQLNIQICRQLQKVRYDK